MSLDLPREWKEGKDSDKAEHTERIELPDGLTGIIGTPLFRRSPAEFGLDEEHHASSGQYYNWFDHRSRVEYAPEGSAGATGAIQRLFISDAPGSSRERGWDVEAGLARLRHRLDRLRSDPAEQRRLDELLAEIPPPESFVRTPPAAEPLIEVSPRSGKSALDTPPVNLRSKDEHGKAAVDNPLVDSSLFKDEHSKNKIRGLNQIRGKDELGGRGKLSI